MIRQRHWRQERNRDYIDDNRRDNDAEAAALEINVGGVCGNHVSDLAISTHRNQRESVRPIE
jgi:hypothetical protein